MKIRFRRFWTTAMIGYAVIVLILAAGTSLTTRRFDSVSREHVNHIRSEENQITFAERLRWSGEAIVSTGRGYLISGDPAFLVRLKEAQTNFDQGIRALSRGAADARTTELVGEIQANADAFRRHQEVLVASMRGGDAPHLATRFDMELVPLQLRLVESLDRLIDYKESAINSVYERVADQRARLRSHIALLLGALVVGSLAISSYIAGLLGKSYRKEQEALETSRRAVAARDEIMGVVAHDLRNPLASIAMRATLLAESDNVGAKTHGKAIETVTTRMAALIKSMLDVATIESGHFTVRPESCSVDELLGDTIEMFGAIAEAKQIHLELAPVAANVRVHADRERVLQVLENLVGNAIKFTHQGGFITVGAERESDMVRFRVSDSGPGVPSEHLSSVFDRFWKHETGGKKGTGLGLFIAKGIIDAHGGRIWAENGTMHGATFFFTLPIASAPAASRTNIPAKLAVSSAPGLNHDAR